ncbi:hypothetical protein F5144DRAFT_156401 [Chaetomium tenue]|uniref:Uncharacterized protein n=1 Tax=Chaetomium tenue TaxID=1854479 RepID=A0ACB7PCR1_9PEZI|nr:hypothetical protein F5144DRAFT_156401 [Chaetomium globosum]
MYPACPLPQRGRLHRAVTSSPGLAAFLQPPAPPRNQSLDGLPFLRTFSHRDNVTLEEHKSTRPHRAPVPQSETQDRTQACGASATASRNLVERDPMHPSHKLKNDTSRQQPPPYLDVSLGPFHVHSPGAVSRAETQQISNQ